MTVYAPFITQCRDYTPFSTLQRDYDKAEQECQRYKTLYDAAKDEVHNYSVT
jgi:hypothetical protein